MKANTNPLTLVMMSAVLTLDSLITPGFGSSSDFPTGQGLIIL